MVGCGQEPRRRTRRLSLKDRMAMRPSQRERNGRFEKRRSRLVIHGAKWGATKQLHGLHALAMRGHIVRMDARGEERSVGGYSVAYSRDDTHFPVYATAAMAAIFFASACITGATCWLVRAVAAAGFTYYNLPLLETGRPTIGANQYGIFIQAFGLIRWRAIERIDLIAIAERAMTVHELQITLNAPLGSALVADWREQPAYRTLMRLPWRMDHKGVVRVNAEPLDQSPDEIHRTLLRMWRYYRS